MKKMLAVSMFFTFSLLCGPVPAQPGGDRGLFQVRSTAKSPEAVVEALKAYAEARKWQYLGETKVKQGEITLVKLCIPSVGQQLWPLGLHLSAMLPCGNLGVYRAGGKTEISLLSARYMQVLHPHPAIEKAAATAEPLLSAMLEEIASAP